MKTKNKDMQIRIRKEYVELLEKNCNYEDCVNEYKNLLLLIDERSKNISSYKEEK